MGRRYRQRGGGKLNKKKKGKLFDIKTPTRYDIPIYRDYRDLKRKYSIYKKRKSKRNQKGGLLFGGLGLAALGGLSGLFG